jgi:hypothetical protein
MRTPLARPLLLLIGLLAFAPVASVVADQPQRIPIDDTFIDPFLSGVCGFPVQVHIQGTLIVGTKGDLLTTRGADYSVTFTNLDTGKSIVVRTSGLQLDELNLGEGVFNFTFSGASRLVIPGTAVFIDAGRTEQTITFDPVTGEIISFSFTQHGRHDTLTFEMICMLLS